MTSFKITDEKTRTELLEFVLEMQDPLNRAFSVKPTTNDINYMKSKTKMIMLKIADSVVFAKRHNMPELVDSSWLQSAVFRANQLLYLPESEAYNKNRTMKTKVYEIYITLIEDFSAYAFQLLTLAVRREYNTAFKDISSYHQLCEELELEIAKGELVEARRHDEIDFETFTKKMNELYSQ